MSELAVQAREKAKSKAERLVRSDPHARVDASDFSPAGYMHGDIKTGPRPVSRRQFRSGGKVHGEAKVHAGKKPRVGNAKPNMRMPRASGGATTVDGGLINRDIKVANESRDGIKFEGGMKRGGTVHGASCSCSKCSGGRVGKKGGGSLDGTLQGMRPQGGRLAKASGGRAKKGMNVNIIIAPASGAAARPPMPMPPPGAGPVGLHQGAPPPPMPAAGAPAPMPAPMMRKRGGRTQYPIDSGAGGGLGRLEKIKAYG